MTKADLVERIGQQSYKFTKVLTSRILDAFYDAMIWGLRRKGRIELRDFGVFYVVELPARTGRNPKTGEPIQIPKSRHVRFKMSKKMKEFIND